MVILAGFFGSPPAPGAASGMLGRECSDSASGGIAVIDKAEGDDGEVWPDD